MRIKEIHIKHYDCFVYPLSDFHIGEKGFTKKSEEKLKGYIKWIKETPNAYAILNGDLINVATLTSPSSPFEQNLGLDGQIDKVVKLLSPIKDKIWGAISGNHEQRLDRYVGYSPMITICDRLGVSYMGNSAVYIVRMCCKPNHRARTSFSIYSHHSTGGGRTVGSKMNSVDKMRELVANCDVYVCGHQHLLGVIHAVTQLLNVTTGKVETVRQMLVNAGGYLEWNDSYAEKKMLPPLKVGSPRIHFIVKRKCMRKKGMKDEHLLSKDLHISV